jgi:hypothetical protein
MITTCIILALLCLVVATESAPGDDGSTTLW